MWNTVEIRHETSCVFYNASSSLICKIDIFAEERRNNKGKSTIYIYIYTRTALYDPLR